MKSKVTNKSHKINRNWKGQRLLPAAPLLGIMSPLSQNQQPNKTAQRHNCGQTYPTIQVKLYSRKLSLNFDCARWCWMSCI
jgi:hypothetical protein